MRRMLAAPAALVLLDVPVAPDMLVFLHMLAVPGGLDLRDGKERRGHESKGAIRDGGRVQELCGKSRWPSWTFLPNEPYDFCGRKATL